MFSYKRLGVPQKSRVQNLNLSELADGVARTDLLYLKQTYLATAQSNVLKLVPEKRTHAYLMLDKTIFHPKGGGQPSDRGRMTSTGFQSEIKKAIHHQGVVIHWVKILQGTPALGPITCELDWGYRYLIMQRHTAAHLLDHCLAAATSAHVETTDSWLDEPCYVGYRGSTPDSSTLHRAQALADKLITADAPVKIDFLDPDQAKQLLQDAPNFERLPDLQEIRTVTIEGCDPIPCGGTHLANIQEIGRMSILRAEQMPDSTFRVHFDVGN